MPDSRSWFRRARCLIRIFVLTWAPIFLGLALRSIRSRGMTRFSTGLRHACALGTVALCVFICVTRSGQLTVDWKTNVTVSAVLIVAALVGAAGIARALRLPTDDAISYMTSFPARHIGVLAAVAVTTLHRLDDLVFILVYFVLETSVILAVVGAPSLAWLIASAASLGRCRYPIIRHSPAAPSTATHSAIVMLSGQRYAFGNSPRSMRRSVFQCDAPASTVATTPISTSNSPNRIAA